MTAAIGTALAVPSAPTSGALMPPKAKLDAPINPAAVPAVRPWLASARIGTLGRVKPIVEIMKNSGTTMPASPNAAVEAVTSRVTAETAATVTATLSTRCGP